MGDVAALDPEGCLARLADVRLMHGASQKARLWLPILAAEAMIVEKDGVALFAAANIQFFRHHRFEARRQGFAVLPDFLRFRFAGKLRQWTGIAVGSELREGFAFAKERHGNAEGFLAGRHRLRKNLAVVISHDSRESREQGTHARHRPGHIEENEIV